MGSGRWTDDDWKSYSTTKIAGKTVDEVYHKRELDPDLDPKGVKLRESRDSADNPLSTAAIISLDVTGSMDPVVDAMARTGLNTIATEIYKRKPVTDPHLMFMGIGDAEHDRAPLQVTQFEADIRIAEQLNKIWIERGGGGNSYESYALSWYFAAHHTAIDCFEKRGKKGYLFTVGDEEPTRLLTADAIKEFLGDKLQADVDMQELLTLVSRKWEIFHIMVEEGNHYRSHGAKVKAAWTKLLGQRAIPLSDHTKLGEVIISTIQILEGESHEDVVDSWDGTTSVVVAKATKAIAGLKTDSGVATL